jgi:hypothetical protein
MKSLKLFPLNHKAGESHHSPAADPKSAKEHPLIFEDCFWLWRNSLLQIAHSLLGDPKMAIEVVESCFIRASHNPPRFDSDGAFGSWILRILIDEALLRHCQLECKATFAREKTVSSGPFLLEDDAVFAESLGTKGRQKS